MTTCRRVSQDLRDEGLRPGAIVATDFFSVEVLTQVGLVRHFVLFVIDINTRRVHITGITDQLYGAWKEFLLPLSENARSLRSLRVFDSLLIRARALRS